MSAFSPDTITLDTILSYAALGLIVGFGYYVSMRLNAPPEAREVPAWLTTGVNLLRLAAAIAFFAWVASLGMVPILSAFAGFLCGRIVALRAVGYDA
ncbi:MAG: N-ATPase subunit AtpR [Rhodospirillales bacterium]